MGDKGGGGTPHLIRSLAKRYHEETWPLTHKAVERGKGFLAVRPEVQARTMDRYIYSNPLYRRAETESMEPVRTTFEDQYRRAQENIIANMPSGGGMRSALTDLDIERAQGLTNIEAEKQQQLGQLAQSMYADEMARAYGLATMTGKQSMGSLGAAAAAEAQAQAGLAEGKWGAAGDLGSAIGSLIGAGKP